MAVHNVLHDNSQLSVDSLSIQQHQYMIVDTIRTKYES